MLATEVIKKKRDAHELSAGEIRFFISGYAQGQIPDYQMSALLMAIFLNSMTEQETAELTLAMLQSGEKVLFPNLTPVDKHSTGGVGDKTSLILGPIVAACGVPVPMMSGRGLGHTGGTLDKLEAIPGFNVNMDLENFRRQVESQRLCFIGQSERICPADKKIYALRDVTGTVESLPLICASIMSKKIAEGISGLVLDVKWGSGAFMKTPQQAESLARGLLSIGKAHGLHGCALITDMNQPLGRFVGNALEVGECLSILRQEPFMNRPVIDFSDTQELSLALAAEMVALGKNISLDEARQLAGQTLRSGAAYDKFAEICKIQGGDLKGLQFSKETCEVLAPASGFVSEINGELVGIAGIELGAGRKLVTDAVDPKTGIELIRKLAEPIKKDEPIFRVYHNGQSADLSRAVSLLQRAVTINPQPPRAHPLIGQRISL
jgi:pyrimidine-nucleoside phosphorylase